MTHQVGFSEVKQVAQGRWQYVHQSCGINLRHINYRKHTPCQGCGGKDRFRVLKGYTENGSWLCSGGGDTQSGDGFALLGHVLGLDKADQLKAVKAALGMDRELSRDEVRRIQRKAAEHQKKVAVQVAARNERSRLDSNVHCAILDLESYTFYRKRYQRIAGKALKPTLEEDQAAAHLSECLAECYEGVRNVCHS